MATPFNSASKSLLRLKISAKAVALCLPLLGAPLFSAPALSVSLLSGSLLGASVLSASAAHAAPETANFEQVLNAAMNYDTAYRAARYTLAAEREEIGMAKSQLLPNLSFGAGYVYEDNDNIYTDKDSGFYDPAKPRSSGQLEDDYWRFNLRQPLFDSARYQNLNRAKKQVSAAEFRYEQVKQELIYRVAELWLGMLYAQLKVQFSLESLESLDLRQEQAQRQDELGVGDQLELLEIGARRDLAEADLLAARSELDEKLLEIQMMSGRQLLPPKSWVANVHQLDVAQQPLKENEWNQQALGNNRYQEQMARVEMADAQRQASRAGHYPTLNLNLDYSRRNSDDEFREKEGFTASVDLNLELYGGGKTSSALRQAEARLSADQAQADNAVKQAQQAIAIASARQQNLYQRLQALKNSMISAQRYHDAATRGESLGLRSQIDIVEANTRLFESRERHAEALVAYLLADLRLHLETGQLVPNKLKEYDLLFSKRLAN